MRRMLRWLVLALAFAAIAGPAQAEWLEASNKHFIVYGNISRRQLATFTDRLERYGAAVRYLFRLPEPPGGGANRVTIYVVGGTGAVQKYYGGRGGGNVAGFYRTSVEGSFIVTPLSVDSDSEEFNANLVLFHEYAHHLLLGNSSAIYPGWMSEGLAELLSTAIIDDQGAVTFGAANNARAESIFADSLMSVKSLLDSDARKLDDQAIDQKYARGWLLTHYLLFSRKRDGQIEQFLRLIAQGTPPVTAGTQVFGDLNKLNAEVNAYRTQRLNGLIIKPDRFTTDPVTVRALSPAEAAIMPLRFESATGVTTAEAKKLIPNARKIAATNPTNGWIQRIVAEMEYDAGNDAEAEAACDRALAIDPKNLMAMVYKARIHLRRAVAAKPSDPALWRDARQWIVKANRIDPDYALPLVLFYTSYLLANETPRPSAIDGLLRAVELAPQDDEVRLLAFGALLDKGDLTAARRALAPVGFNPHATGDNPVRAIVQLIDSGADVAAVRAAAVKAKLAGDAEAAGE